MTWRNVFVGHYRSDKLPNPVLDALQWTQHVTA